MTIYDCNLVLQSIVWHPCQTRYHPWQKQYNHKQVKKAEQSRHKAHGDKAIHPKNSPIPSPVSTVLEGQELKDAVDDGHDNGQTKKIWIGLQ